MAPQARPGAVRVLGIDPGSRVTGFGLLLLDGSRVHYERSGVIAPRATLPFSDRLLAVYDGLLAILGELQPDEVAVESAFVRKSALAALQIGHVRGVILLAARQHGASIHEYTAPEVKLAVVRHGAAAKDQVGFMVRRLLPQAGPIREDEADALAVALCHAHRAPMRRLGAR
ncbi:MAG TPA: crossover junction endodeoxyribonuclease RuvC [Candidatus Eisenbacteria bacterium]|jgi:crossover junction endodeoxyribonuclease RuvC|nr:crossover junction endodeoxyribonuclease RuvC [Candidatus Eisenbacteria bacterium]